MRAAFVLRDVEGLSTSDVAIDHLATCASCRITVDELEAVRTPASDHGRLELPPASKERIRRSLDLD